MASTINVLTTGGGGIVTSGDSSGVLTIQKDGSDIASFNSTGLSMASGKVLAPTGPAFSAYSNAAQTISTNTNTKIVLNNKDFDTNSNFDNTTNYRFTPTVAGYYQINAVVNYNTASGANAISCRLFKNGSLYKFSTNFITATGHGTASIGTIVYFNGSTDYLELYTYQNSGSSLTTDGSSSGCILSGALVRAA